MPTYRIYYSERDPGTVDTDRSPAESLRTLGSSGNAIDETEWEEEVEASDGPAALQAFFAAHAVSGSDVMWVDANGDSRQVEGTGDYETDKVYIWIENGKLMEYQGLDEGTPGLVSCPLCEGAGEVTVEVADEYLADYGEEIAERE
jgi:hypothetical protein